MAGVLRFDGIDDTLKWTTLASALANVSDGAWTMACVVKRNTATTHDQIGYLISSDVPQAGMAISADDDLGVYVDTNAELAGTFTTGPYMFVVSKAAGTVAPRAGYKTGSAGAWTHANFDSAIADQVASNALTIGEWPGYDYFDGWIGVIAFWEGAMSDANKEALGTNWRTSDLWNSAHGTPAFLAELNVAGVSVVDRAGNATSLTATGTTLDSGETLESWTFGVPVALAGVVNASSTLSAALPVAKPLAGVVTAATTVAINLAAEYALAGAVNAASATTAALPVAKQLAGDVLGKSVFWSPDLPVAKPLAGIVAAISTVIGDVTSTGPSTTAVDAGGACRDNGSGAYAPMYIDFARRRPARSGRR